jgi:hypothetical protein
VDGTTAFDQEIEKSYAHLMADARKVTTAGITNILRPASKSKKVSDKEQKIYCSALGYLFQLIKYSGPDIANVVRNLSNCMVGATYAAFKGLKRVL